MAMGSAAFAQDGISADTTGGKKAPLQTFNHKWSVGVAVSGNINIMTTGTAYMSTVTYYPFLGTGIGINANYRLFKWLSFRVGAMSLMKSHRWENALTINGNTASTSSVYENRFVNIPVLADFSIGKKTRFHLFLGGYLGYWTNGHIIGSEIPFLSLNDEGVNNDYEFDSRRDNRFEAGLAYGLGLAIPLSNRLEMDIDLITHYGLTDMQKKYMRQQNPRYNTTTMLQLGLAYNF